MISVEAVSKGFVAQGLVWPFAQHIFILSISVLSGSEGIWCRPAMWSSYYATDSGQWKPYYDLLEPVVGQAWPSWRIWLCNFSHCYGLSFTNLDWYFLLILFLSFYWYIIYCLIVFVWVCACVLIGWLKLRSLIRYPYQLCSCLIITKDGWTSANFMFGFISAPVSRTSGYGMDCQLAVASVQTVDHGGQVITFWRLWWDAAPWRVKLLSYVTLSHFYIFPFSPD